MAEEPRHTRCLSEEPGSRSRNSDRVGAGGGQACPAASSFPAFPTLFLHHQYIHEKTAIFANVPGLINNGKSKKLSILTFGCKRHIFQEPETARAADSQLLPESSSSLFSERTLGSCFISPGFPNVR